MYPNYGEDTPNHRAMPSGVLATDDLAFLWFSFPDLVAELCPHQNSTQMFAEVVQNPSKPLAVFWLESVFEREKKGN